MLAVTPGSDDEELFSKFQKYIGKSTDEVEESITEPFNRFEKIGDTVSSIYQATRELNQQLAGSRKYVEQIGINFTDAGNKILNFADNVKTLEDAIALVGKVAGTIQENRKGIYCNLRRVKRYNCGARGVKCSGRKFSWGIQGPSVCA